MKKLLFILLLIFSLKLSAQTYVPFDFENSEWGIVQKYCQAPAPNDIVCGTHVYKLAYGGDTTYNGVNYKIIDRWTADYSFPADSFFYSNCCKEPYCLIREDSQKVYALYLFNADDIAYTGEEVKIYDFTLNIGDTVHYPVIPGSDSPIDYYQVVTGIDSMLTSIGYRKTITMSSSSIWGIQMMSGVDPSDTIVWIENIGSNKGLLYDIDFQRTSNCCLQWYEIYFLCHNQNNQYVYGVGSCDYATGLEDSKYNYIAVYPNPTDNTINLQLPQNQTKGTIQLYNVTGSLIHSSALSKQIDVSGLPNGMYYLRLQSEGGVYSQKVVIAR